MALYLGAILGGPEQMDKPCDNLKDAITLRVEALQRRLIKVEDGLLNIVFQFSGSIFRPDFSGLRVGRYIKKERRLEVKVAVPPDMILSDNFAQQYVALARQAIVEGKKVFDK